MLGLKTNTLWIPKLEVRLFTAVKSLDGAKADFTYPTTFAGDGTADAWETRLTVLCTIMGQWWVL